MPGMPGCERLGRMACSGCAGVHLSVEWGGTPHVPGGDMKRRVAAAVGLFLMVSGSVRGDGKMFAGERIPDIPFQRALLYYRDGRELLIVQSAFTGKPEELGWVIPCPSPPKVGALRSDVFFRFLSVETQPRKIKVSVYLALLLMGAAFVLLCVGIVRSIRRRKPAYSLFVGAVLTGLLGFLWIVESLEAYRGIKPVEVLAHERVGIFDVRVVRSDSPDSLLNWLLENKFQVGEADRKVIGDYVGRGWCFATARIRKGVELYEGEGLVLPLVLAFSSPEPVYPLALTGTIGAPTEVRLYAISPDSRFEGDERFEVRFAGPVKFNWLNNCRDNVEPADFFEGLEVKDPGFMTYLKAVLEPDAMKEDLVLKRTGSRETYQRWQLVW